MEPILEVKNLHTSFHTSNGLVQAVRGVDLSLRKGEILGVVGESGSGKSVTCMEHGGKMVFELFPQQAPITVENFRRLAQAGFYNGLTFHRVVNGYVIQGGSEDNTCMCPTDFTIRGEFGENGVETGLDHRRGAISMARDDDYGSAGTQFFVVHQDAHQLDGRYAAFGYMREGFEVLDAIAQTPTLPPEQENRPLVDQVIASICVEEQTE